MKHAAEFFALAVERESIRLKRAAGLPAPWTTDEVFKYWRFCNVRREDDKTTAWFRERVRSQVMGWQAVTAVVAFRWFNRIEVGERLVDLLVDRWDVKAARERLAGVAPVTTGSYMIKTPDGLMKTDGVLACITAALTLLKPLYCHWGASLRSAWVDLQTLPYMGRFMAYEVVSDLRWTNVLQAAGDINSWASAGPGCARGLSWVVAGTRDRFKYGSEASAEEMTSVMYDLLMLSRRGQHWPFEQPWEMREVEHWACEYWKYVRCRDFGQPPKQRFKGGAV